MRRKAHVGFGEEDVCILSDESQTRRHVLTLLSTGEFQRGEPGLGRKSCYVWALGDRVRHEVSVSDPRWASEQGAGIERRENGSRS